MVSVSERVDCILKFLRSIGNFSGSFKSRTKRINSCCKLIEFLSGGKGSADTVVNVVMVEFSFGAVILIEKLVFNVAYEKIGVAESKTHGYCALGFTFVCAEALRTLIKQL